METRAKPNLKTVEGLWRRPVKGCRGAMAKPATMTQYIGNCGLLPDTTIAELTTLAPLKAENLDEFLSVALNGHRP